MKLSVDPKPFGAFIEYTLKPLIDDSTELIQMMEKMNVPVREVMKQAVILYIVDKIVSLLMSLLVTGLICFTVLKILGCRPLPV